LYTLYNRLSNQLSNRLSNWFDNRLYRVYKHLPCCQTGLTTSLITGCIVYTAGCQTGCTTGWQPVVSCKRGFRVSVHGYMRATITLWAYRWGAVLRLARPRFSRIFRYSEWPLLTLFYRSFLSGCAADYGGEHNAKIFYGGQCSGPERIDAFCGVDHYIRWSWQ